MRLLELRDAADAAASHGHNQDDFEQGVDLGDERDHQGEGSSSEGEVPTKKRPQPHKEKDKSRSERQRPSQPRLRRRLWR